MAQSGSTKRRLPIRVRLTLWYFVFFAGAGLLLSLASWLSLRESLDSLTLHELDERVDDLESLLASQDGSATVEQLRAELLREYRLKDEGKWLQVIDEQGNWLYRSARPRIAVPLEPLPAGRGALFEFRPAQHHYLRSYTRRSAINGRAYEISTAISADKSYVLLRKFRRDLIFLTPAVLLMAALAGHVLSRKALRPVAAIAKEARRINDRNLGTRLPVANTHDELSHLSETLNQMLERIEVAFRSVRSFTANASHELRTPISLIRTRTEIALCFPRTAEEYRSVLEEVQSETVRMTSLVETMLALARSDAGAVQLKLQPIECNDLLRCAADEWTELAAQRGLRLEVTTPESPIFVLGEPASLKRLFRILLDNACRYTARGGSVWLRVDTRESEVVCSVRDTGIGIASEHLPYIFERFYRGARDGTRSGVLDNRNEPGGSGLGLALAKWITDQHSAQIAVNSTPGEGSCFRVVFAKCEPEEMQLPEPVVPR